MTPDEKVMTSLSRLLPPYIRGCRVEAAVPTATEITNGKAAFKIWTTMRGNSDGRCAGLDASLCAGVRATGAGEEGPGHGSPFA
jgi:hypothetical protein